MDCIKVNYKNWVPKGLILALCIGTITSFVLLMLFGTTGIVTNKVIRFILTLVFLLIFLLCAAFLVWSVNAYNKFSYKGKRKLSKQVIDGIADYVHIPNDGIGLDIGCGSGALTIACAKRNSKATMMGIDRWGKEYASFNKQLCENNAKAEEVSNVKFLKGNAVKLDFPDESFDAVTSNYVYHNISGVNKQELLLESLRVLKKGGTFAIHDLMSKSRYGDMNAFVEKLHSLGYESVELIDTTDGNFMNKKEAKQLMLSGSILLVGKK